MNDRDERPTQTHKPVEGYHGDGSGVPDDASFHDEILDNPKADAFTARRSMERAIRGGMDPAMARRVYGFDNDDAPEAS